MFEIPLLGKPCAKSMALFLSDIHRGRVTIAKSRPEGERERSREKMCSCFLNLRHLADLSKELKGFTKYLPLIFMT